MGKIFFDKGDDESGFEKGEFVVERVAENNNFVCSRVGAELGEGAELFDMSYVIHLIREYEEE